MSSRTSTRKQRAAAHKQRKIHQQRNWSWLWVASMGLIAIGLLIYFFSAPDVAKGDAAPDFTAVDAFSGQDVSLSDYRGQVVMVNFWATWCPPCRAEMPLMQQAYTEYADDGFAILAVNNREQGIAVRSFAEQVGLSFPVLLDEGGTVQNLYGVQGYPMSVFVDAEGIVYEVHTGAVTARDLDQYINQGLARSG